jgi:hypothetical protein
VEEALRGIINIKYYHRAKNCGKYADGFYYFMIDIMDSHIPSPLILFTCTELRHVSLELQRNKGDHLEDSKSKLNADRPDRSNYFNYKNNRGRNPSCCTAMHRKLITSPGVAVTYRFLMNTWNALPESYQQMVYKNILPEVQCLIQQAENPMPAVVITMEVAGCYRAILLDYLISEVALEARGIARTDLNVLMDTNFMDDELGWV